MMSELDPKLQEAAGLAKDPFEIVAMAFIFRQQKLIGELMDRLKN
jgi:hypothetical protein